MPIQQPLSTVVPFITPGVAQSASAGRRRVGGRSGAIPAWILLVLGALLPILAVPAAGEDLSQNLYDRTNRDQNQYILRAAPTDVGPLLDQYGLVPLAELDSAEEYAVLVAADETLTTKQVKSLLSGDARVSDVTPVELASLPVAETIELSMEDLLSDLGKVGDFTSPCLAEGFTGLLWSGYADQEAVRRIRLHDGQAMAGECGAAAVVAVIDTGVDPEHPLLAGALVDGYDFVLGKSGLPSEWSSLDQTVSAIVEQTVSAIVEQTVSAIVEGEGVVAFDASSATLDQTVSAIVEQTVSAIVEQQPLPPFFGHGTMVAGLVRLTAPAARIMPLRVFDGSGRAHLFDVVQAIYWATDHGADVINMSFSMESPSPELLRAISYARGHGVVLVAASGNQGERALTYPAALGDVIGVASVDDQDALAAFSNYGTGLVDLAAPGTGIVSAYPGGLYGAGWGTSFSTPLVSGTVALLEHLVENNGTSGVRSQINAIKAGSESLPALVELVGHGRLDVVGAFEATSN